MGALRRKFLPRTAPVSPNPTTMSPEQQRIAIAKACGWTNVAPLIVKNVKHEGDDITVGISSDDGWIPDYLNDRNAMLEANQMLIDKGLMWQFANQIIGIICRAKGLSLQTLEQQDYLVFLASSTAELEAEAFLRTLDLWKPTLTQPQ